MAVGVAQEPPVVVAVGVEGEPGLPQLVFVAAAQGPEAEPLEQELGSLACGDLLVFCYVWHGERRLTDAAPQDAGRTLARAL